MPIVENSFRFDILLGKFIESDVFPSLAGLCRRERGTGRRRGRGGEEREEWDRGGETRDETRRDEGGKKERRRREERREDRRKEERINERKGETQKLGSTV